MPGFISQPFFERAHETFSDAIGLRAMASNQHVDEPPTLGQLVENGGSEMSLPYLGLLNW